MSPRSAIGLSVADTLPGSNEPHGLVEYIQGLLRGDLLQIKPGKEIRQRLNGD